MQKVFITGSEGFIGSHLTEKLVRSGYEVTALVQYNSFGQEGWLKNLSQEVLNETNILFGDVRDGEFIRKQTKGFHKIYHLAALISIPYSYNSSKSYIETNLMGTYNILEAARTNNIPNTIITSTSEVYGTARYTPINEEHPLQGQSPYSASKIGADKLAESYNLSFDLPITIVRPFNTYGPRQSPRAIIPTIILQLLNGKEVIELGDLSPTRDMVYVKDTAEGFKVISEEAKCVGETVNIATGQEISIGEIAKALINKINPAAKIKQDQKRMRPSKSEVRRLLGCNKKLEFLTDWVPSISFDQGIKETIDWYTDEKNRNHFGQRDFYL